MNSPVKQFLFILFVLVCIPGHHVSAQVKPNIVVLFSDDAGYGDFGFTGSQEFDTPRLDNMAAAGITFEQGYVASTVCHPSRVGIMTGQNPVRFGQHLNSHCGLPDTTITIAGQLKKAGYHTGLIGKWHLGQNAGEHPLDEGFDEFYGFLGGNHNYYTGNQQRGRTNEAFDGYLTDIYGQEAVNFIENNQDSAFFLFVSFNAVHGPYHSRPEHEALYQDTYWPAVGGMTWALDSNCGLILDKLDELNLAENTLVFFLNDNGGAANHNNAPFSGRKGSVLEGGVRVPFLAQWKGVLPAGTSYNFPVSALDIFATASALAGVPLPDDRGYDGINIMPFLLGQVSGRPHKYLYWEKWQKAIRYLDYKFMRVAHFKPMLYDVSVDVTEQNNLIDDKPGLATALNAELERFLSEEGIPMLPECSEAAYWDTLSWDFFTGRLLDEPFVPVDSGIVLEPETSPDITGINKWNTPKIAGKSITLHRNGSQYELTIHHPVKTGVTVLLTDLRGQKKFYQRLHRQTTLLPGSLARGIYLLKINTRNTSQTNPVFLY